MRGVCTFEGCGRFRHGQGLCAAHHLQHRRGKHLTPLRPASGSIPLVERFWAKVDRTGTCWEWTGTKRPQGYGAFAIKGRLHYAHRVAWEFTRGRIPEGKVIDHICFNRACVNPEHLRVTTSKRNAEYRTRGKTPIPVSGIRGVYPIRDKWMARLRHAGVQYDLGHYEDKEEAGRVVAAKRAELFQFPEYQGDIK